MLGPWIADARALGTTPAEKDYYERQARTILSIWGGPVLNDYANRMWGGLVKDYYDSLWFPCSLPRQGTTLYLGYTLFSNDVSISQLTKLKT